MESRLQKEIQKACDRVKDEDLTDIHMQLCVDIPLKPEESNALYARARHFDMTALEYVQFLVYLSMIEDSSNP